ncbi:MAG: Coenzyme F420 hydrogenase/dehydrogenase, beta subunit C-terminal domain [Candidatus Bathyarchaeota archaeon]|nr:Coenzyme F420 hydrogenase/dehydrogenase, beta subunit C-terminal domain [Candidatus Bathyarchaeota archaeon]
MRGNFIWRKPHSSNRKLVEHMAEGNKEEAAVQKDENIGVFSEVFSARSGIDGQDGGMVTALLIWGMQKGLFDAAVVVQRTGGYRAQAATAETPDEVMAARRTEYLRVSTSSKLRELVACGKRRIAVVCTPCEAFVAKSMQQTLKAETPDVEVTVIGLFCFEAFNYAKLKKETQRILGVDIDKAEKTQIHKGKFTVHTDGKEHNCRIRDLDGAVEEGCRVCSDFSARSADLSIGSAGSPAGYSTVIVRSDAAEKLLEGIDIVKIAAEKEEIVRLSKLKKERAQKSACRA